MVEAFGNGAVVYLREKRCLVQQCLVVLGRNLLVWVQRAGVASEILPGSDLGGKE